jgi:Domain of unknown function (DUF4386)
MTRATNARIAGFTYLFYIAVAFPSMVLFDRATSGEGIAARLASMAQHATEVRVSVVLALLGGLSALVLAVTLFAITRDQDPDLAMLGLTCRVAEGVTGAVSIPATLGLLWVATATGANAPDSAAVQAIGAFVLKQDFLVGATFFAVGSTLFSWLLLRGRMIPAALAWLGVAASVLLVVGLPLQLAGFLRGPVTQLMWLPMAAFEIPLGLWWLIKGDTTPAAR